MGVVVVDIQSDVFVCDYRLLLCMQVKTASKCLWRMQSVCLQMHSFRLLCFSSFCCVKNRSHSRSI